MKKILFFLLVVAGTLSLNSCGCIEYIDPSTSYYYTPYYYGTSVYYGVPRYTYRYYPTPPPPRPYYPYW